MPSKNKKDKATGCTACNNTGLDKTRVEGAGWPACSVCNGSPFGPNEKEDK